jgi:hypothetical protein
MADVEFRGPEVFVCSRPPLLSTLVLTTVGSLLSALRRAVIPYNVTVSMPAGRISK